MLKEFIKYFILALLFTLTANFTEAKKVSGYIITEKSDTLYGQIKLSKFDIITGTWMIFGIYTDQLHHEVWFKENNDKRFRKFQAIDINGFEFSYKSKVYIFRSFTLKSNTILGKEKKRERFLQLIYTGELELYWDTKSTVNNFEPDDVSFNTNQSYTYYDLYLYNKSIGLTKVEISKDVKTIKQLLKKYEIDKEYLKRIPDNAKLKDIEVILKDYDFWLKYN
jgi:hypothetical protein